MIPHRSINELADEDCNGWLLLYRGKTFASRVIQRATGSPYSHAAILLRSEAWQGGQLLDVAEVREWIGGRKQPLESQIRRHEIDVFRPRDRYDDQWSSEATALTMRSLCGCEYGYGSILQIALRKLPILWRFARISEDETETARFNFRRVRPTCSQAVWIAYASGGLEPIRRKPSYLVTPGDLGHSPLFEPWGKLCKA